MSFYNMLEEFLEKANSEIGSEGKIKSNIDINSLLLDRVVYQKTGLFKKRELVRFYGTFGFDNPSKEVPIPMRLRDERLRAILDECAKKYKIWISEGNPSYILPPCAFI